MSPEWHYITTNEDIWATWRDPDPYSNTREVILHIRNGDISVRWASNERAPYVVSHTSAPVEVIAEVLRKAGWTVTPPEKKPE